MADGEDRADGDGACERTRRQSSASSTSVVDSSVDLLQSKYAHVKPIAKFLPEAEPEHSEHTHFWMDTAWWGSLKLLLLGACVLSVAVLVMNVTGTILLSTMFDSSDIYRGSCETAAHLNSALHILINILSTLLLGASNMCMQFLAAPSRKDVDAAHKKGHWLDIGIPSLRNIRYIPWPSRILWFALLLSSAPLAFLWNSALSETVPMSTYEIDVVTPEFLSGGLINVTNTAETALARAKLPVSGLSQITGEEVNTTLGASWGNVDWIMSLANLQNDSHYREIQDAYKAGNYSIYLDRFQCVDKYQDITGNASNGILVTKWDEVTDTDPSALSNNTLLWSLAVWGIEGPGNFWICGNNNTFDCRKPQDWLDDPAATKNWTVFGYKIDYCLVQEIPLEDLCSVNYLSTIMIIVCVFNAVKCVCIFSTTFYFHKRKDDRLLVTIGDAATSYLEKPEALTKGACLASQNDLVQSRLRHSDKPAQTSRELIFEYAEIRPRWFRGASRRLWFTTIGSSLLLLFLGIGLLGDSLYSINMSTGSTSGFKNFAFGSVHVQAEGYLGALWDAPYSLGLYCYILFANVWQLLISSVYFQYNALLTSMLANQEWQAYSRHRKQLRVSWPKSFQRGAYFLSLPWRYALPLQVSIAFLHYTLSQSVFVVITEFYGSGGVYSDRKAASGFSVWPIITSIIFGSSVIAAPIALGFRRYTQRMPINATSSLVISAACHRPDEDEEAHLFPVQWGVVSESLERVSEKTKADTVSAITSCDLDRATRPSHCCLTTYGDVKSPIKGRRYA